MGDWDTAGYQSSADRQAVLVGLLVKVYLFLAVSMAFTAAGALVGAETGNRYALPATIGSFVLLIALRFLRDRPVINLGLMYAFTLCMGFLLSGILAQYARLGLTHLVYEAGLLTVALTVGLSAYGLLTRRDLSGLRGYLFITLLGLVIASIAQVFLQLSVLNTAIGGVGAILFSLYIAHDVNQARTMDDTVGNAIMLAVAVYLDIINLFLSLMRILRR